jgi:hypothetical protein
VVIADAAQAVEDEAASDPEPEPEEAKAEPEPEPEPEEEAKAQPEPEEVEEEPAESSLESLPKEKFHPEIEGESDDDDIIDLTDVVDEPAYDDEPEQAASDDLELVEPEPAPAPQPQEQFKPAENAPHLQSNVIVGDETQDAAMAAFNMLAGTLLTKDGNSRSLEDLVQVMLRPMLKAWLDQSLPGLVERLVQDEIERISRGHRS